MLLIFAIDPRGGAAQPVQVVRATGPGAWGEQLRVVEELRIGALDGPLEQVFGRVEALAASAEGVLYVADPQVPVVRAYDAEGRFLRDLGREGEGPGEYRTLYGLRVTADSGVAIWDVRNGRITVFDRTGGVRATHSIFTGWSSSGTFQVDHAGRFYVRTLLPRPQGLSIGSRAPQGWIQLSPSGEVLDTLVIPFDAEQAESFTIATPAGHERPFISEIVTAMSPLGYLVTGRSDSYALELRRPEGTLRIEREHTPLRLTSEERNEWVRFASYMEGRIADAAATDASMAQLASAKYQIPDVKPAFRELLTDSEGRIWVRRYVAAQRIEPTDPGIPGRPSRTLREPPTFDVFEPGGRFLGTVVLPMDARFQDARGRSVWATVRGQFDETYIVRYRVEPRGGG